MNMKIFIVAVAGLAMLGCEDKKPAPKKPVPRTIEDLVQEKKDKKWVTESQDLVFPTCDTMPKSVVRTYDKFDERTTFESKFTVGDTQFTLFMICDGKIDYPLCAPQHVNVDVLRDRSCRFDLVVDDKEVVKPNSAPFMSNHFHLDTADLLKIAKAKQVDVRVGPWGDTKDFVMSNETIALFRDFASIMHHK